MGGPASPLLWALAYDPVVVATADTADASTPTYVDDLSGHVRGAPQALVLSYFRGGQRYRRPPGGDARSRRGRGPPGR
eukprot:10548480-Alexandrium_andersonii.AAC.1